MAKSFRPWDVEQNWLLPPSVQELVPPRHPAHFVREVVRTKLDLSAIFATYEEERGYPPYHPTMMTALLLYGYTQGLFSSRKLAKACEERIDFMAVTAMQKPDYRTIGKFRLRHLEALGALFVQVLKLCSRAGLVRLGHVALDGTKVRANASKHKAMSYKRMRETEARLREEVASWFQRADAEDMSEDAEHGDGRGDEMPDWVANKMERLAKIEEAKAALEEEARQEAAARTRDDDEDGPPPPKTPKHHIDGTPGGDSQRNFTDPESRILKTRDGYLQGYNAQAAVDGERQIIVATEVFAAQNDVEYLDEMLAQIRSNTGRQTRELSADYGYLSEANLIACRRRHIEAYIATGRLRHADGKPKEERKRQWPKGSRIDAMEQKLLRGGRRSRYRLRKQIVEPVFGQIKAAVGFARFLLRGLWKVRGEWRLVATAHNLRKLIAAGA